MSAQCSCIYSRLFQLLPVVTNHCFVFSFTIALILPPPLYTHAHLPSYLAECRSLPNRTHDLRTWVQGQTAAMFKTCCCCHVLLSCCWWSLAINFCHVQFLLQLCPNLRPASGRLRSPPSQWNYHGTRVMLTRSSHTRSSTNTNTRLAPRSQKSLTLPPGGIRSSALMPTLTMSFVLSQWIISVGGSPAV